ncbi:MAG: ATP-binding cassette domain-containing protein, partial [Phycisphaerales bacterium]
MFRRQTGEGRRETGDEAVDRAEPVPLGTGPASRVPSPLAGEGQDGGLLESQRSPLGGPPILSFPRKGGRDLGISDTGTRPIPADREHSDPSSNSDHLLRVDNLRVRFGAGAGAVDAVRGVSFTLRRGETVALVGESGSGKSVTALSILQLLPYPLASHPGGRIRFQDGELIGADRETMRRIRGDRIAMIFQEPMTSLNPLHTIERQVGEAILLHRNLDRGAARARVVELLRLVGLPDPERRLGAYPHELSGGQRQRVMIAM